MPSAHKPLSTKVSLLSAVDAIKDAALMIEQIEEAALDPKSEEYTTLLHAVVPAFDRSIEDFKSAVDRRIHLLEGLPHVVAMAKANAEYFLKRVQAAENILDHLKETTKQALLENPDIDFTGSNKRFVIQKNGGLDPVEYKVELQGIKHVVDPNDVKHFPEEYLEKLQVFVLKKKDFDEHVRSQMVQCSGAQLGERGCHIRIK